MRKLPVQPLDGCSGVEVYWQLRGGASFRLSIFIKKTKDLISVVI